MNNVVIGKLVESISTTVAISAENNEATGEDIMYALAMVSLVAQGLHADGVKSKAVAGIFDSIALELQPDIKG